MEIAAYIIKSNRKACHNWSGKEFSNNKAKIYFNIQDVISALETWYEGYYDKPDGRVVKIISLTDNMKNKLLDEGVIRL